MKDVTQSIRQLEDQISECDLLGVLAMDEKTRLQNREQAAANKALLAEAKEIVNEKNPQGRVMGRDTFENENRA